MKAPVLLALGLAFAAMSRAQVAPVVVAPRPAGVTTLVMGLDVANGVAAPAPGSRVRVPPLEQVTLVLPDGWTYPIQWRKDNKAIEGATGHRYVIPFATTADSGVYQVTGAPFPFIATGISLDVVEVGHVGNFSARLELAAGSGATQIVGFVVGGKTPKSLLFRAVGPSLKAFGVTRPVTKPQFRYFDAAGRELVFSHPAVVFDWPTVFAAAGAFPLGESGDTYDSEGFSPGSYTIQVSDASGQGGTVLLEVYELPANAFVAGGPVTVPVVPPAPP